MRRRVADAEYSDRLSGEPLCSWDRSFSESWRIMDARPSVAAVFESQRGMSTGRDADRERCMIDGDRAASLKASWAAMRSLSAQIKALRVAQRDCSAAKRARRPGAAPFACKRKTARAVCWILDARAKRVSGSHTKPNPRRDSYGVQCTVPHK